MKLSIRAMAITSAFVWGILAMFLTGLANLIWPSYGQEFLRVMASIYPGYHAGRTLAEVVVGGLYGLVDGAGAGAIFAWLYNRLAGSG